jgi:hypothetical protein
MSFGKLIDPNDSLIRSLETQGIQRLYSTGTASSSDECSAKPMINTNNHKKELKKLNHSILIAYLDLLDILVKAPNTEIHIVDQNDQDQPPIVKTLRQQKLEDIELLFINMHHLINELRPHQARDTIRCILEMQRQQRIEIAQKFKLHLYKIVNLLKKCIQSIQTSEDSSMSLSKKNEFLDELSNLVSNATKLTKSLDAFGVSNKTAQIQLLQETKNKSTSDLIGGAENWPNEVEMIACDDKEQKELDKERNNLESKTEFAANGNDNQTVENKTNCDYKDLILCNIIDDFLFKENEF